jgi:hypothetical protein
VWNTLPLQVSNSLDQSLPEAFQLVEIQPVPAVR